MPKNTKGPQAKTSGTKREDELSQFLLEGEEGGYELDPKAARKAAAEAGLSRVGQSKPASSSSTTVVRSGARSARDSILFEKHADGHLSFRKGALSEIKYGNAMVKIQEQENLSWVRGLFYDIGFERVAKFTFNDEKAKKIEDAINHINQREDALRRQQTVAGLSEQIAETAANFKKVLTYAAEGTGEFSEAIEEKIDNFNNTWISSINEFFKRMKDGISAAASSVGSSVCTTASKGYNVAAQGVITVAGALKKVASNKDVHETGKEHTGVVRRETPPPSSFRVAPPVPNRGSVKFDPEKGKVVGTNDTPLVPPRPKKTS